MNKEKKYYHFKTNCDTIYSVSASSYEEAEEKACRKWTIIEYLGWTSTLEERGF